MGDKLLNWRFPLLVRQTQNTSPLPKMRSLGDKMDSWEVQTLFSSSMSDVKGILSEGLKMTMVPRIPFGSRNGTLNSITSNWASEKALLSAARVWSANSDCSYWIHTPHQTDPSVPVLWAILDNADSDLVAGCYVRLGKRVPRFRRDLNSDRILSLLHL